MALIEIDTRPSPERVRRFGRVWFPLFVAAAGFALARTSPLAARWAWGLAALVGVLAWIRPSAIRPLYLGLIYATAPIGWIVSHIVLGVVYYLVVTPLGRLLALFGRDPMTRRFDPDASSYWVDVRAERTLDDYFRQF